MSFSLAFNMNSGIFWFLIALAVLVGLILVLVLIKWIAQGGKYRKKNTIEGKVVIVTGANTGIGKETALELAKRGATVYMACRDMKRCELARKDIVAESQNSDVHGRQLDLSSFESIRVFAERFKSEQNRLDILINNGGVMGCPRMLTKDGFEMQFGVNHLGHFLLTNLLLDLLKQSAPSRIVVVSSTLHTRGEIKMNDLNSEISYSPIGAYSQSKLANVLFTKELSKRLVGTGVTVNALHPGVVETELVRHFSILNNIFIKIFVGPMAHLFMKTPKNGAQTSLCLALDPELENVSGQYFKDCKKTKPSKAARDDAMAQWLWEESERLTKLNL